MKANCKPTKRLESCDSSNCLMNMEGKDPTEEEIEDFKFVERLIDKGGLSIRCSI
jgi:hypothetical protein